MRTMPKKDRTLVVFGHNVARIRNERGISQDTFAEKSDLDRTYISGIERGVRNPGIKSVLRIARALRAGIGDLCKGVDT